MPGLQLQGFNNLTKTLSFNSYDIGYAATPDQQAHYIAYLDEAYNAERLTRILQHVAEIIGANILNIARQDYEPHGASVTLLVAEQPIGVLPDAVIGHLDKSHITVHTYPESHPDHGISTFRTDIDVSTCGCISPLKALNDLMHSFKADLVSIDYRVRGFTRDVTGKKHFIDHPIHSIRNFLADDTGERYQMIDVNLAQERIFHTRMLLKNFNLNHYLFGINQQDVSPHEQAGIERRVRREMAEIFYGGN